MLSMESNKQTIYYALYEGKTDAVKDGYKTGEKVKTYSDPVKLRINVSAAKGTAEVEPFGIDESYSRTMSTSDINCPIKEDTILWVGIEPSEPHNYKVTKVAKSLNSILFAIKEVGVS